MVLIKRTGQQAPSLLLLALWGLILLAGPARGQSDRNGVLGLPQYLQHYTGSDYKAFPQNWSVAQDQEGVIYVGNSHGVLQYEGVSWLLVPVANRTTVRSVGVSPDNTVYVGAQGEFGFLARKEDGTSEYVSLIDRLPLEVEPFEDVWGTHAAGEHVYFQTRDRIFRWGGDSVFVYHADESFHTAFSVRGDYYVRDRGRGLLVARGDSLVPIPGGEAFQDHLVYVMAPLGEDEVLIGTRGAGLFRYDGRKVVALTTEADPWLQANRLYAGATIMNRYIVLGTLGGGVAVVDSSGTLLQIVDEDAGLPDGWINYVFADHQHGIWLALHNRGLVRLDLLSQLRVFDERQGLYGVINYLMRRGDELYVSTSTGLFILELSVSGERLFSSRFRRVGDISSTWMTAEVDGQVLAAAEAGLYRIDGEAATPVAFRGQKVLATTLSTDGQLYVGVENKINLLENTGGRYQEREVARLNEDISSMVADSTGFVWALTKTRSLYQVKDTGADQPPTIRRIASADSLLALTLTTIKDGITLVSSNGVFSPTTARAGSRVRFSEDRRLYIPPITPIDSLLALVEGDAGDLWLVRPTRVDILSEDGKGGYTATVPAPLQFLNWGATQMLAEETGAAWISSDHILRRYDPAVPSHDYRASLPPLLRQISIVGSGERISTTLAASEAQGGFPVLGYDDNALRFDFALPSYNDPGGNEYQFLLEGQDATWSEWTRLTHKNYTNLTEGTYRFRLRGRNAQGSVSPETIYTFRILPPWYRTWWAYAFYAILLVSLLSFFWHYRRMAIAHKRAKAQAAELERERMVNERLQESYRRLQEANESLLQADKLKDEFLANTSHELRTPLTAILGFASILKDEVAGDHREFMGMIEENGKRLLYTLNSLLDLAKLRAGMMDVTIERVDVSARAHEVAKLLGPLASRKGIALDVRAPEAVAFAPLDRHCAERILYNLVGNAIKFTDAGRVSLHVGAVGDEVVVTVTDTGVGIEAEFIPHLFDEFKQESSGNAREHEGTGLGLAITNRLVQLMNGSIEVASQKNVGSVFTVRFPRYQDAEVTSNAALAAVS